MNNSSSPLAPLGDRWTADRGAIPSEPMQWLDSENLEESQAVVIEHEICGKPIFSAFEGVLADGVRLGLFDTASDAARACEIAVDTGTFSIGDWTYPITRPKSSAAVQVIVPPDPVLLL